MCKETYKKRMEKWKEIWSLEAGQRKWRKVNDIFAIFCGVIITIALCLSIWVFQGEDPLDTLWKNVLLFIVMVQASFASGIIPMILIREKINKKIARLNIEIKLKLDELRKG